MNKLHKFFIFLFIFIVGVILLLYGNSFECTQSCIGCSSNELSISLTSVLLGIILSMIGIVEILDTFME